MPEIEQLAVALVGDADDYYRTLDGTLNKTRGWAGKIGGVATKALGGLFVGGAAAATAAIGAVGAKAFDVSRQTSAAAADMAASLGVPREEAERFADVAQKVYGSNFADSVTDAASVVEQAYLRMGDVGDFQLQRISERAIALRDVFEVETGESLSAAETLMENFGLTSDQAMDFIAAGFQRGLDRSGDFLESITEYSTQFRELDADAGQFFSVLETGMQGGMLGTDKAADLLKEFRVRVLDGSDATMDAVAALDQFMDRDAQTFFEDLSSGALSQADAFGMVQDALRQVDDRALRMQLGVALLGTQFEDLGDTAVLNIDMTKTEVDDLALSADTLDERYNTLGSFWQGLWRQMAVALSPTTDKILEMANDAAPHLKQVIDDVGTFLPQALDRIAESKIITFLTETVPDAVEEMREAWETDAGGVATAVENMRTNISTELSTLLKNVEAFLDDLEKLFTGSEEDTETSWADWLGRLLGYVTSVGTLLLSAAGRTLGALHGLVIFFDGLISGDWQRMWDGMQMVANNFFDFILDTVEFMFGPELRNKLVSIANDIFRWWNSTVGKIAPGLKVDLADPGPGGRAREQDGSTGGGGGGFGDRGESEMERRERNRRPPEGMASTAAMTPTAVTAASGGAQTFAPQINVGGVTIRGGSDEDRQKLVQDIMVMLEREWQMANGQGTAYPVGISGRV